MKRTFQHSLRWSLTSALIVSLGFSPASAGWLMNRHCKPTACKADPCEPVCEPVPVCVPQPVCPPAPCGSGDSVHAEMLPMSGSVEHHEMGMSHSSGPMLGPGETMVPGSLTEISGGMPSPVQVDAEPVTEPAKPPVLNRDTEDLAPKAPPKPPAAAPKTPAPPKPAPPKPAPPKVAAPKVAPTPAAPVAPATPSPKPAPKPAAPTPVPVPVPAPADDLFEPAPAKPAANEPAMKAGDDLFGDDLFSEPAPAPAPADAAPDMPADGGLDDLFGDPPASAPADPAPAPAPAAPAPAMPAAGGLDDLFGDPAPADPAPAMPADGGLDDLFGNPPAAQPAPADKPAGGLDDLFGDPPAAEPAMPADGGLDDLFGNPPAGDAPAGGDTPAAGSLDDLFGQTEAEVQPAAEMPVSTAPVVMPTPNTNPLDSTVNRSWVDNTGTFRTEGRLIEVTETYVRLAKTNGRTCTVPWDRLSDADAAYVRTIAPAAGDVTLAMGR